MTRAPTPAGAALVDRLAAGPRADRVTHVSVLPAREGQPAPWPRWAPPALVTALRAQGVHAPWQHQVRAAELGWDGHHVVLATGTASGKSLGYLLPALTAVTAPETHEGRGPRRGTTPAATVLYLAPTKALAQDQLQGLLGLGLPRLAAATHDGDSGSDERRWARDHATYLLSNPDMLHHSLLPGHARWSRFLSRLRYVVVDECHRYRGVFGAHMSAVLRRLRRVCAAHGSHPTFMLASATVAEPEQAASRLTGLPTTAVTEDTAPRGAVTVALWQPPFGPSSAGPDPAGPDAPGADAAGPASASRRSAAAEVTDLLADLVLARVRTLAFLRSRRGTESVALGTQRRVREVAPELAERVAAYRGGYLAEDRRGLEQALRSGDLLGLAATNALELGIDVSGLDAVLLAGYPGSRSALWQQVGRAGRDRQDAVGVLVASDDPLDSYLVSHPEALLGSPVEASVFDPDNPYVLGPHLCAAAAEVPLTEQDLDLFGPNASSGVAALTEAGMLRRRPRGWFYTDRRRATDLADIRSAGGPATRLVEADTGRLLGTVDAEAVHRTVHRGAVYLHRGEAYLVRSLDRDEHVAVLQPGDPGYTTTAKEVTNLSVVCEREHRQWGKARVSCGEVSVTHRVVGFLRRRVPGGEVIGKESLDLPEQVLPTTATWWTVPDEAVLSAGLAEADLPGAAHAAEHAAIGLLPLFATCDRSDIGGVSAAAHPDTGRLTVFVYDGHPGGAGFAERGYAVADRWLGATRDTIAACTCESGCPSCVQSPKCGNGNHPLDKAGAVRLLEVLLALVTG